MPDTSTFRRNSRWQHMATFSTLANGHLLRGYYSFVEDFLRNGQSAKVVHRANFGNGWIRVETEGGPQMVAAHTGALHG